MSRWRLAARIARRDLRRWRWRTLGLVLLVGLPAAAISALVVITRNTTRTESDTRAALLGQADDMVELQGHDDGPTIGQSEFVSTVRRAYPVGSDIIAFSEAPDGLMSRDGTLRRVDVSNMPLGESALTGIVELVDGRAPRRPGEVAVSADVLRAAEARVGGTARLLLSGEDLITGVVRVPTDSHPMLVVGAGDPPSHPDTIREAFVVTPDHTAHPRREPLARIGAWTASPLDGRFSYLDGALWYQMIRTLVSGGVVLAVAAVVVSAAVSMPHARALRTLGLLSAAGAPRAVLRRVVFLRSAIIGVFGTLWGTAVGVAGAALVTRPLRVRWTDLAIVLLVGVSVSVISAWLPARFAIRLPVLAALSGRRPQDRVRRSLPVGGVVVIGIGIAALGIWARRPQVAWGYSVAAVLALLAGGIALIPWLVSRANALAERLNGAARLALRDIARQRLRSCAAVVSLLAPAGLCLFTATLAATDHARSAREFYDDAVSDNEFLVVAPGGPSAAQLGAVRAALVDAEEITTARATRLADAVTLEITTADGGEDEARTLLVADPTSLRHLGAADGTIAALRRHDIVVFAPLPAGSTTDVSGLDEPVEPAEVVVDPQAHVPRGRSVAVVSPATARAWGLDTVPYATLFRTPKPLTDRQREAVDRIFLTPCDTNFEAPCDGEDLEAYLRSIPTAEGDLWLEMSQARDPRPSVNFRMSVAGVSALFFLGVAALVLALVAAENTTETSLLEAIGVAPGTRRSIAVHHALWLSSIAMALALPGSLVAAYASLSAPHKTGIPMQIPWETVGALGLGVPLVSVAIAWIAAGLSGRRRRDLSLLALSSD